MLPENIESKFMLWWAKVSHEVGVFSIYNLTQKAFEAGYQAAQQPRALDFCPECLNTGYRRVSPNILSKCSCEHGQSQ